MVVIDMATFAKPEVQDTPEAYQSRCITFDAQRAAMMQDSPEKCCFWEKNTAQRELWMKVYVRAMCGNG